jgi:putative molybdopterin biosynthesis protein
VQLIGQAHLADLVIIGSHCVGLDVLIGRLQSEGISVKALNVGSTGGLAAAKRGECDIAAIHLMDPATGEYNRPFLTAALELVSGYRRLQGIVYRKGDPRFEGQSLEDAIGGAISTPECLMVNRNAGSGTRILTDRLLGGATPAGYWSQPKSHNAVGVAVPAPRPARYIQTRQSPGGGFCLGLVGALRPSLLDFWIAAAMLAFVIF